MRYNIVIADDEERIVHNMKKIIEEAFGEKVIVYTAFNGIECTGIIKKYSVDLLITDIRMPGADGIELVKFVRSINSKTKILVISAYEDFNYAKQLIPYGVMEYIVKPIKVNHILAKIKSVIEEKNKIPEVQSIGGSDMELELRNENYHTKDLIKGAKAHIRQNLYNPVSLTDVADYLHVNKSYLSTVFKNETGENISNYINNEKVKEAKKLLLETEQPVNEIAEKLGYSTTKYFIEKFSKSVGITPAKYRNLFNKNLK